MRQPLDPIAIPLVGRQLIEASAGTGKTYTITGLYLRLLLEQERSVADILVVTYTEAACQELKDKIRARLLAAQEIFETGHGRDAFLVGLLGRYLEEGRDPGRLRRLIDRALIDFDLAAVFTIHGFCMRALEDAAFESGMPFDLEFIEDDAELVQQVIDDYWRRESPAWPQALLAHLAGQGLSPDSLPRLLRLPLRAVLTRGMEAIRHGTSRPPAELDPGLLPRLTELWRREQTAIRALLRDSPALRRSADTYRLDVLEGVFTELDRLLLEAATAQPLPLGAIGRLRQSALQAATLKKWQGQAPSHPFFEAAEELCVQLDEAGRGLLLELIMQVGPALGRLKAASSLVAFDDLLTGLRAGLRQEASGPLLAARLLAQYPVALIDEFQDTDPIQYEIFHTIYQRHGVLFMVGDPKQAIYGFRGADIFSYLEAARSTATSYTLTDNWRSEPGLVAAVNHLFGRHPAPFLLPGIDFRPVGSPKRPRRRLVGLDGDFAPLSLVTFDDRDKRGPAKAEMAGWLAGLLARLLTASQGGEVYFEDEAGGREPLSPGDIAILVRSNDEAHLVKEALAECGLSAVTSSRQSVFHSPEGREFAAILEAVAQPADEARLRRALTSRLLGLDLAALERLEEDAGRWDETLDRFALLHRLWRDKGVAVMLRRLWAEFGSLPRLAAQSGGERRLTNLRHLTELLQAASVAEALSCEALVAWLAERRQSERPGEASLLRLESDDNLLQIVTVHKSKGLQYPLVLAPFFWDSSFGRRAREPMTSCHDEHGRLWVDIDGGDETSRLRQRRELLAEELRLLYVALTRAENRCLLFWGRVKSGSRWLTASSALQYLVSGQAVDGPDVVAGLEAGFGLADRQADLEGLSTLIELGQGSIMRVEAAEGLMGPEQGRAPAAAVTIQAARVCRRQLSPNLGLRSFSGLHQQVAVESEGPDHDSAPERLAEGSLGPMTVGRDIFAFPRGARAGSCLHAILEAFDFQDPDPQRVEALVRDRLQLFGLDPAWTSTVRQLLDRLVATPLTGDGRLRLREIGRHQRLDELEFYYPLPGVADQELRLMLQAGGLVRPAAGQGVGFMKGFIDLVFEWQGRYYIVDYKSNYLGPTVADYGQGQLALAMSQAGYDLQYRIYTVALHRYLERRLAGYDYDRHFGGVFYLFLRGLEPSLGPEFGVYSARPLQGVVSAGRQCPNQGSHPIA